MERRPSSGRHRVTTAEQDNLIVTHATEQPFTTAASIARIYNLNQTTVARRLKEGGLNHQIPATQAKLTEKHRYDRVKFCEENQGRDWDRVIFSDEKTFKSHSDTKLHLWRPRNERYNPRYVQSIKRSGHITCGVWGFITSAGVGELCEISPHMDSPKYCNMLEEILIPSMHIMFGQNCDEFLFMQDNAGIHKSRFAMNWFESHPEVTVLAWPPLSPDLNPIENVWGKMVYGWDIEHRIRISRQTVLDEAMQRWNDLIGDTDYINALYNSMPNRLQQVIDRNGNWCSY